MNHFDIQAKVKERDFFRTWKKGFLYFTGNGKKNSIVKITEKSIYFETEKSQKPLRIPRKNIQKALSCLLFRRTATRKELEAFSPFSSAVLGILRMIVSEISRVTRTVHGLLRLTLLGTRFIFSGVARSPKDMKLIRGNGGRWVMMSYFHLRDDPNEQWKEYLRQSGLHMILDSGEYSLFRAREKGRTVSPITIQEYAAFVRTHLDCIHAYFNLDVLGDAVRTRQNQFRLTKLTGVPPIPVWHVQSPWSELERLVEEDYEVIGIGGSVKLSEPEKRKVFCELFDRFPGINFHILGLAGSLLWQFPWFSADGTSWVNPRKNGPKHALITPNGLTGMPEDWHPVQGVAYNISRLAGLETYRHGVQLDIPCAPEVRFAVQMKLAF